MRLTGGYPGAIGAVLARCTSADSGDADFERVAGLVPLPEKRMLALSELEPEAQRILGLCAVGDGMIDERLWPELAIEKDATSLLMSKGFFVREPHGYKLIRAGEAPQVLEALGHGLAAELHRSMAMQALKQGNAAEPLAFDYRAKASYHLACAGEREQAAQLLWDAAQHSLSRPQSWCRAADILADQDCSASVALSAALIHEAAGHPERAIALLDAHLRTIDESHLRKRVLQALGSCNIKCGRAVVAIGHLRAALSEDNDGASRAVTADLLSRALIQSGAHKQAVALAQGALGWTENSAVQADLHEDIGVASSYLGDNDAAQRHLQTAAALQHSNTTPRSLVGTLCYQAIHQYRVGNVSGAAQGYRSALAIAQEHGLSDQIASAALNLGTACHQQGEWGEALEAYEKGWHVAVALGQSYAEMACHFNLAQLYADLGAFERADLYADKTQLAAHAAGNAFFEGAAYTVKAEVALARGTPSTAEELLRHARELFLGAGAMREVAEVDVHLSDVALATRKVEEAEQLVSTAASAARSLQALDLDARVALMRGKVMLTRGDFGAARLALEDARQSATKAGLQDLVACAEAALSQAWEHLGASASAQHHLANARQLWERACVSLSPAMRDLFWQHPKRKKTEKLPERQPSNRERNLERLLEINRKLNSSLNVSDVLRCTMDAAIELTQAERGFVILRESEGAFRVPVARNLDREHVGKSHAKFSRTIAEQVIKSGEPVVAVDAATDARFRNQKSIHAMRLRSILAVPIRSPDGILGALYLDNRFSRETFKQVDVDLLFAFSDQVAIALSNARLHDALARRTAELEAERQRVEALLQGQAEQIDRLKAEVHNKQEVLEHRYNHNNIIGRSAGMRQLFAKLDRVIDSSVTVLIEGESGSGKELVARAIHFNGPRSQGPFVALNCAAMPGTLVESELFGHERGAFTGALQARQGLMQRATGGTLFLDEIGEMALEVQAKLLRVLQEREVRPLGAQDATPVDFRLIAATNRHLEAEVAEGRFRQDLFYRIGVVTLAIPPLAARSEDIPDLVRSILERIAKQFGRPVPSVEPRAMQRLLKYSWPGNVRQLENVLTSAMVLARGDVLRAEDIDLEAAQGGGHCRTRKDHESKEGRLMLEVLARTKWNVAEAARTLGIPRGTFYRKLKRHGIAVGPAK